MLPPLPRPPRLPCLGLHAGNAAREGLGRRRGPPREDRLWPARRIVSLADLDEQYGDWRERVCNARLHATGRFIVSERLAEEREVLRPLPPQRFDYADARASRVPLDGYLRFGRSFYRAPEALVHQRVELRADRDTVWIAHPGSEVARYPRSWEPGTWLPAPRLRPEPPPPALPRSGNSMATPGRPATCDRNHRGIALRHLPPAQHARRRRHGPVAAGEVVLAAIQRDFDEEEITEH